MVMRDHRPKSTLDLLENNASGQVRQRALALAKLNEQIKDLLPAQSAKHCRVANYRDGTLILECGSSSWATRLNYDRQMLLSALRREALPTLSTIEIKVNPDLAKSDIRITAEKKKAEPRTLSPIAAEYLKAVAEMVPDKLKKRLEAIAALSNKGEQ